MMLLLPVAAAAEPAPEAPPLQIADAAAGMRAELEMRRHLMRVNVLGGLSLAGGAALTLGGWEDERLRWAGICSMGSGVIDLVIGVPPFFSEPEALTAAEIAQTREVLAVNVGLDVAYLGTGLAMGLLAEDERIQGVGWGLAVQGLSLAILDLVVWARLPRPVF